MLTVSGADVILMYIIPTPRESYITRADEFDCGIIIFATHNPFYDNVSKIIDSQSAKIDGVIEKEGKDYIDGLMPEIPLK